MAKENPAIKPRPKLTFGQWILVLVFAAIILFGLHLAGVIDIRGILNPFSEKHLDINSNSKSSNDISLSASLSVPGQSLAIYGRGFGVGDPVSVRFFDDKGYDVILTPVQFTDDKMLVTVPPYVDFDKFSFTEGTVNVQVIKGSVQSNTVQLDIAELPTPDSPTGTATKQYLDDAITQAKNTKKHLLMLANLTGVEVSDSVESLDALALSYGELKKQVEAVMADSSKKIQFGKIGEQTLYLDQETLKTTDKLFGSITQVQLSGSDWITGAAVADSSCHGLAEGIELGAAMACVRKHVDYSDVAMSLVEKLNEMDTKNPLLTNTLGKISFISDVHFYAITLPGMYTAYLQDLDAATALTGREEYELTKAMRYKYLDKLAEGTTIGKGMALLRDIIAGPNDKLYDKILYSGRRLDNPNAEPLAIHLAADPNRLPTDTGLKYIVCTDTEMCPGNVAKTADKDKAASQPAVSPVPAEKGSLSTTTGKQYYHDFSSELIPLLPTESTGGPYTFYLGSGVGFPPMGLTLGIDGVLRGTPTGKSGNFQVCVKDVGGRSACRDYNIDVSPSAPQVPEIKCPTTSCDTDQGCCGSIIEDTSPVRYLYPGGPTVPRPSTVIIHVLVPESCACPSDTSLSPDQPGYISPVDLHLKNCDCTWNR